MFIYVSADWSVQSRFYERHVLSKPAVREALDAYGVVAMEVDLTRSDQDALDWMEARGLTSAPHLLIMPVRGEPRVLGDNPTAESIIAAIADTSDQ